MVLLYSIKIFLLLSLPPTQMGILELSFPFSLWLHSGAWIWNERFESQISINLCNRTLESIIIHQTHRFVTFLSSSQLKTWMVNWIINSSLMLSHNFYKWCDVHPHNLHIKQNPSSLSKFIPKPSIDLFKKNFQSSIYWQV